MGSVGKKCMTVYIERVLLSGTKTSVSSFSLTLPNSGMFNFVNVIPKVIFLNKTLYAGCIPWMMPNSLTLYF